MYDEHIEHGWTKPMTKPQYNDKIVFKNLNEHEKWTKNSNRIIKNVNKNKKKYTINHRKAVNAGNTGIGRKSARNYLPFISCFRFTTSGDVISGDVKILHTIPHKYDPDSTWYTTPVHKNRSNYRCIYWEFPQLC